MAKLKAPSKETTDTMIQLTEFVADNEGEIVGFLKLVEGFSEDGNLDEDEIKEVTEYLLDNFGDEIEASEIKNLVKAVKSGNYTAFIKLIMG